MMLDEYPSTGPALVPRRRLPTTPQPGWRILVVDDNEDAAATLAVLLHLAGHQTHVAHDGLAALAAAAACRPDVVLLDLDLPKLSGHEVGRRLRAQPGGHGLALVAVTAMDQELHRQESRRSGFDAHLVKPVEFNELERVMQQLLGAPRAVS